MIATIPGPVAALDIEGLYRAHLQGLYAFVYARVGNREAAEDLTGAIFARALTHLGLARAEHSIMAWLYHVARTTVADYWRRGHAEHSVALKEAPAAEVRPPASDVARQADTAARARALLDSLPENYRRVLSHRLLDGASVAETARLMNLSEDNVKVLQHRALTRAAQLYGGDHGNG